MNEYYFKDENRRLSGPFFLQVYKSTLIRKRNFARFTMVPL